MQRTPEQRIAIAQEYLGMFIIWTERLDDGELETLRENVENMQAVYNSPHLNRLFRGVADFLKTETTTSKK